MDGAGGRDNETVVASSIDLDASETASKLLEASAACGACLWSLASSGVNALAWKTWTRMMNLKTKLYSQMSDMRLESHDHPNQVQNNDRPFEEPIEPLDGDKLLDAFFRF